MLTGFNTDFKFKGTVYHVQTEDNGLKNPTIVTLLYQGGAILASRKISYADIVKSEHMETVVRDLMEEQHKQMIKDLMMGKVGQPAGAPAAEEDKPVEEPSAEKGLDDIILDYLSGEDKH